MSGRRKKSFVQAATESPEDARPAILYIGEDRDAHPLLKHSLRAQGYRVLAAYSVEDAADWMVGGHVHADLILLDLVRRTTKETLAAGRQVRRHAKYDGQTPLVVMAEKYGTDVEGTEANVEGNDWVFYLGDEPDQLKNLLRRLTSAGAGVAGDWTRANYLSPASTGRGLSKKILVVDDTVDTREQLHLYLRTAGYTSGNLLNDLLPGIWRVLMRQVLMTRVRSYSIPHFDYFVG